jgi:hypothetical protein
MSPALAVATVELAVRNDRLKRELERPLPTATILDLYDELCRRIRAELGQS